MAKVLKYSHYRPHARVRELGQVLDRKTGELVTLPSMTKQEFVRESDINNIIKSYSQTGMINHINAKAAQGAYQDLPDSVDFQDSLHIIKAAESAFMTLPAKIRDRFGQDPAEFLAFMADPANDAEIRELGLAKPLPLAPPPKAPDEAPDRAPKADQPKA